MARKNPPFEDDFPLKMGIFHSHVGFQGVDDFVSATIVAYIVADDKCSSCSFKEVTIFEVLKFRLPLGDPCCILLPGFVGGSVLIVS